MEEEIIKWPKRSEEQPYRTRNKNIMYLIEQLMGSFINRFAAGEELVKKINQNIAERDKELKRLRIS